MILSTHAVVGGAIASLMPGHPVLAFVIGAASHFAIDAIPHVDYPLYSISVKRSVPSALSLNWLLVRDLGLITLDACLGLLIVLWLYASPGATTAVLAGALGAMLPDPYNYSASYIRGNLFDRCSDFTFGFTTKRRLSWPIGVSSQLSFVALVVGLRAILR
jgi:hypothetical protein